MIEVQALKEKGHYKSFHIQGHAGYADAGEDIVCAAVSALVTIPLIRLKNLRKMPLPVTVRMG